MDLNKLDTKELYILIDQIKYLIQERMFFKLEEMDKKMKSNTTKRKTKTRTKKLETKRLNKTQLTKLSNRRKGMRK